MYIQASFKVVTYFYIIRTARLFISKSTCEVERNIIIVGNTRLELSLPARRRLLRIAEWNLLHVSKQNFFFSSNHSAHKDKQIIHYIPLNSELLSTPLKTISLTYT